MDQPLSWRSLRRVISHFHLQLNVELTLCNLRPAIFYSYSFAPNPNWTTFFPPGREIYTYLESVANKAGITEKFRFNTDVTDCKWLEDERLWFITVKYLLPGKGDLGQKDRAKLLQEQGESAVYFGEEKIKAKIVVSCVGGLVEPKAWPEDIPGIERFKGPMFHSARWNYNVDFKDKDVLVVGTGCSAAQFVPLLTKPPYGAKSVTQLMRSPPWVVDRLIPPGGDEFWEANSVWMMNYIPGLLKLLRWTVAAGGEWDFRLFGGSKWAEGQRQAYQVQLLQHMKRVVPEKYHEILTPDYGVGCKRRIFDATWLPGLQDPNIELTTLPLTSVQENSVTLGPGRLYPDPRKPSNVSQEQRTVPADVIVLANGFDVQNWFHPLRVTGRGGKDLVQTMEERGGPQAYQGTAMDGFPNYFILYGPNTTTGHSSVVMAVENMIGYALNFIKPLLNGDAEIVEVKREAEEAYTQDLQRALKDTVWMKGGCQSWYFTKDGWNSTVLPYSQIWFWYRCMFPRWRDWNISYTTKGKAKLAFGRIVRFLSFMSVIAGAYWLRNNTRAKVKATELGGYLLSSVARLLDGAKARLVGSA